MIRTEKSLFATNENPAIAIASKDTETNFVSLVEIESLKNMIAFSFSAGMNLIISSCFYNFWTNKFIALELFKEIEAYSVVVPVTNNQIVERLIKCLNRKSVYSYVDAIWVKMENIETHILLIKFFVEPTT